MYFPGFAGGYGNGSYPYANGFAGYGQQNQQYAAPQPVRTADIAPAPLSYRQPVNNIASTQGYVSQMEQTLYNTNVPIASNETQTIRANGISGIWLNRAENMAWRGPVSLDEYKINNDTNYKIIRKQGGGKIQQTQDIQIKYLRPPAPQPAGDIVIKQESDVSLPAAPPLIIRQQEAPRKAMDTLIIREEPPALQRAIPPVTITIPGRRVQPPPRKVIIEKLPAPPPADQKVYIERWLSSSAPQTRRVRFIPGQKLADQPASRNVIIQWDDPEVEFRQKYRFLGVENSDPSEYKARYGSSLLRNLPKIANSSEVTKYAAQGQQFAVNAQYGGLPRLVGDVEALRLVPDLERYGLSEYRNQIGVSSGNVGYSANSPSAQSIEISEPLQIGADYATSSLDSTL